MVLLSALSLLLLAALMVTSGCLAILHVLYVSLANGYGALRKGYGALRMTGAATHGLGHEGREHEEEYDAGCYGEPYPRVREYGGWGKDHDVKEEEGETEEMDVEESAIMNADHERASSNTPARGFPRSIPEVGGRRAVGGGGGEGGTPTQTSVGTVGDELSETSLLLLTSASAQPQMSRLPGHLPSPPCIPIATGGVWSLDVTTSISLLPSYEQYAQTHTLPQGMHPELTSFTDAVNILHTAPMIGGQHLLRHQGSVNYTSLPFGSDGGDGSEVGSLVQPKPLTERDCNVGLALDD